MTATGSHEYFYSLRGAQPPGEGIPQMSRYTFTLSNRTPSEPRKRGPPPPARREAAPHRKPPRNSSGRGMPPPLQNLPGMLAESAFPHSLYIDQRLV